jgi:hypothetical protein
MSSRVTYRARFGVPSGGVPVYSESDFESPETAREFLDAAFDEGQISDYKIYKVTTTITKELVASR